MNIPYTFNPLGCEKNELPPGFKPLAFYGPMNNSYYFDIKAQYDDTYRLVYKNDKWTTGTRFFSFLTPSTSNGFGIYLGYYDGDFFTQFFGGGGVRAYGANSGVWHEIEMGPVDDATYYQILDGKKIIQNKPAVTWDPNRWCNTTTRAVDLYMKEFELLRNGERVCKLLPAINPAGEKCIVDIVTGKTYKPV